MITVVFVGLLESFWRHGSPVFLKDIQIISGVERCMKVNYAPSITNLSKEILSSAYYCADVGQTDFIILVCLS